tara:strand:+ start:952 stop:1728 length:777 start_codon:yes stop_codon:yes gene_type:complete
MCSSILSSLQTAVLAGIKIDSPDKTDTNTMEHIIELLTQFTDDPNNHTPSALEDFKKLEEYCHSLRLKLKTSCDAAKKQLDAEERKATALAKAEVKRREKKEEATRRKADADHKKDQKKSLLMLNKLLQKPKTLLSGKTDTQVLKWALVGVRKNEQAAAIVRRKAERFAKKQQKEEATAERKRANAGVPKNAAYSKFCSWFQPTTEQIKEAGFEHKRDYNKYVWSTGLEPQPGLRYDVWDDFKKSPEAPWLKKNEVAQ